jgi:hypothetical protein
VLGSHVEMVFAARSTGEARVMSREIMELGWFGAHDVPRDFSRAQHELIKQVLNGDI